MEFQRTPKEEFLQIVILTILLVTGPLEFFWVNVIYLLQLALIPIWLFIGIKIFYPNIPQNILDTLKNTQTTILVILDSTLLTVRLIIEFLRKLLKDLPGKIPEQHIQ